MATYKYSKHALSKHENDVWNARTIKAAIDNGNLARKEIMIGRTADIICGWIAGEFVGLVVSKENNGEIIIITGYAAPREYWLNV